LHAPNRTNQPGNAAKSCHVLEETAGVALSPDQHRVCRFGKSKPGGLEFSHIYFWPAKSSKPTRGLGELSEKVAPDLPPEKKKEKRLSCIYLFFKEVFLASAATFFWDFQPDPGLVCPISRPKIKCGNNSGKFKASWLEFPKSANTVLFGAQSHASSLSSNMATLGQVSRLVCSILGMQNRWPGNAHLIPGKFAASCSAISKIGKREALRVLRAQSLEALIRHPGSLSGCRLGPGKQEGIQGPVWHTRARRLLNAQS
jgi:hypothetical protein